MKRVFIGVSLFMVMLTMAPKLYAGQRFLTERQMLAITATYPKNLITKDEKIDIKAISDKIGEISENVKTLKIKGESDAKEAEDKLKDVKEQIKAAVETHGAHSEEMKKLKKMCEDAEKNLNDLGLAVKGMNVIKLGAVDGQYLYKMLTDKKAAGDMKKAKSGTVTEMTLSLKEFNATMARLRVKASNMTEGSNLLGTDPIPPNRLPGIHYDPTRPNHVREIINSVNTESPVISYSQETGFTDGGGATAEGAAAGQSDFTITQKEVTVKKVNTFFTISKEMMEDVNWVNNYLETRGFGKLLMVEDSQLYAGSGVSPNLTGLQPAAQAYDNRSLKIGKTAGDLASQSINYFDILCGMCAQLRDGTKGYYKASAILMHPDDYMIMSLARNAYGSLQFPQAAVGEMLKPGGAVIVENTVVSQGNALVGDFELGATLAYRDEMTLTFSNQHVDNFTKGFITCLIEERLGLAVHNPNAFVYGNFDAGEASGSI